MKNQPDILSASSLLLRSLSVLLAVALSGCAHSDPSDPVPAGPTNDPAPLATHDCPAYETRNWRAWIEPINNATGRGQLNITGQIDLPSPGYSINLTLGPMDRRHPPSLRINVAAIPPDDAALAVISSEDVSYSVETPVLHYRSIHILCGERQLAELLDVVPTE